MKHPAPAYIRYQRPPVVEPIEPLMLESGERLHGEIKYYDYGVVSVVFQLPLPATGRRWCGWPAAGYGMSISPRARRRIVKQRLERAAPRWSSRTPSG